MERRGEKSRIKLWLFLTADRWTVAGVGLLGFFVVLLLVGALVPDRVLLSAGDPVQTLFQALVTSTITGVTLVVSINSIVLSQELGPLGDQRERMAGSMSFREEVEDELGIDVAPVTPSAFLRQLIEGVETRATQLAGAAAEDGDVDEVSEYAEAVVRHASSVSDDLEDRQFGTFDVISAALDFNYSWKIYEARRLRAVLGDDSGDSASAVREALDDVVTVLALFSPAREHFKTMYFQWELVNLSRAMLYSAVPSLLVATSLLLFSGVLPALSAPLVGISQYVWIVAAAATVTLLPFAVLLSFILRIGTVAKRTLSIGPFILRESGLEDADETSDVE
ncbi:hypothetical protein [Halobellus sp. GM3]|uniref:hypothetical protein n=1 Tax=Halobellus sp. GM3 TaxID=3458410 RepID=UPI00403D63C4